MAFRLHIAGVDELNQHQFLTEVRIERPLYEHAQAHIVLRWQEHTRYGERSTAMLAARILNCPIDVQWKDNDLTESVDCFHGYIEQVAARRDASSSSLVLDCVSFSKRTDLVPRYRTFQATTLLDIAEHVARTEPLVKIARPGDLSVPIVLSVQHAETDFAYLSRMLHNWGIPLATRDRTGEVVLGARGAEASGPFPDIGYGWAEVEFQGALKALPALTGGGSGPTGLTREAVGALAGQLTRKTAEYSAIPDHPPIRERTSQTASQVDTSGYHLRLAGQALPFAPGEVVEFEGQAHLIRHTRITGDPQQTTATQEFWLQPLTLPLRPERPPLNWPSRAVWAHVTANEHDPRQQGRIQVEFEWEHLDPQPSGERAWLHTLTPYGGGSGGAKSTAYSGFYSVPEIGERVLVEFLGDWDSDAVVIGAIREHPQGVTNNPHHTKRWSTPSGNEVTLHTKDGVDVVRVKNQGKLAFESQVAEGRHSVTLNCGGHPSDIIHFENHGGSTRLDISAQTDIYIQSGNHFQVDAATITLNASHGDVQINAQAKDVAVTGAQNVSVTAQQQSIALHAQQDLKGDAQSSVTLNGKAGVKVDSPAKVDVHGGHIGLND